MARVHHRKARKDYPQNGIVKGDMYYTAKIKTGPRSSRTIRSLEPIKPSQMTSSAFKSGWFSLMESFSDSPDAEEIRSAADTICALGEEAQESFDNMPEGLQQGDTGQMLENRASECEQASSYLESLAEEMENLEEPENEDSEYESLLEEYHSEIERIQSEAVDLVQGMPE